MRARSSTGWTSGAATYDSGFEAHNLNRPAPRCSALLSGLVLDSHLVPSPVAFSRSQCAQRRSAWPNAASANAHNLHHNHARYDHLGSVRLITNQSAQVVSRHDYLPFGEEIPNGSGGRSGNGFGAASNVAQMFTGKERDGEMVPNFDYFGARYYGSALGRFTSPDWSDKPEALPYTDFNDPQTINRYAYVRNNPLSKADVDGHCYPLCTVLGGAVLGALTGGGAEFIHEAFNGQSFDRGKITNAAIGGAVAGAISGLAGPEAGLAAKAAISAGGSIIGGGAERTLNGDALGNPTAIGIDAAAGILGAGAEKVVAGAIPDVVAGTSITNGAGGSFSATFRTEASAAGENVVRNGVRTAIGGAAQTAADVAGNSAKDALQPTIPPPPPPPAPKPPKELQ